MLNSTKAGSDASSGILRARIVRSVILMVTMSVFSFPLSLQAQSWSKSLGNRWAGLSLNLNKQEFALFGDKTGLSATGNIQASILKARLSLVEGWVRIAGTDKSYCEKVSRNYSCNNWKRQVQAGRFQKKYSQLYGYKIPSGINWQKATFYTNYGYRVFHITLKNMAEYGNELYEKYRGYDVPRWQLASMNIPSWKDIGLRLKRIGPPSPPRKPVRGNWAKMTLSRTIPLGPFGGINVGAGYAVAPGFTFDTNQATSGSDRIYEGVVRPQISASVHAYGAYDAYVLRGGVRGNLLVFAGGIEAIGRFAQAARRVTVKYRTFYRYLGGTITAYAQHVSGFSCRRHGWHFHCGRRWRTFWSRVLYRRAATVRSYPWRTIYDRVVNW